MVVSFTWDQQPYRAETHTEFVHVDGTTGVTLAATDGENFRFTTVYDFFSLFNYYLFTFICLFLGLFLCFVVRP